MATGGDLSHSLSNASEEVVEAPCKFCLSRDGKQFESTHFCVDCDCKLCKACVKWHQNIPVMSTHQVVHVTKATGKRGKKGPSLPTTRCDEHHGKLIDHFCLEHHKLCCVSCVATKHRNCQDVEYLPTYAQGTHNCTAIKKTKASSKTLLRELKQVRSLRHELLQKLRKEETTGQESLQDLRTKLVKRIDDLIKTESNMIKCEYQEEIEAVQRDIQVVDDQIYATETCNKNIAEFKSDNECQMFVYMKQVQENEKQGKQLIRTLVQIRKLRYTLINTTTLEHCICDIQKLGQFYKDVQLTYEANFNVKSIKDQHNCNISGICMLLDGSLVLADHNNKCLKRLDHSYSIIGYLTMSSKPNGVCYISKNNEVAVTVGSMIQFVSVETPMKQTRSFQVDAWSLCGICYSNDELFVCMNPLYALSEGLICGFTLSGQKCLTIPLAIVNRHYPCQ